MAGCWPRPEQAVRRLALPPADASAGAVSLASVVLPSLPVVRPSLSIPSIRLSRWCSPVRALLRGRGAEAWRTVVHACTFVFVRLFRPHAPRQQDRSPHEAHSAVLRRIHRAGPHRSGVLGLPHQLPRGRSHLAGRPVHHGGLHRRRRDDQHGPADARPVRGWADAAHGDRDADVRGRGVGRRHGRVGELDQPPLGGVGECVGIAIRRNLRAVPRNPAVAQRRF